MAVRVNLLQVYKVLVRKTLDESWVVFRRYTDFSRLNDKVSKSDFSERYQLCVCVCERESVCVCVCVRERERERERECVCVCE